MVTMSAPTAHHPEPAPSRLASIRHRRRRIRAMVAGAATTALLLSGCGLRMETPDPTEPVPDAAESLRAGAVDQALQLAEAAEQAAAGQDDPDTAALLGRVQEAAGLHAAQLGGVYDSGLDIGEQAPTPSATATATAEPADTTRVLTLLYTAADTARAEAVNAVDPELARLLASITAAREQQIAQLTAALGEGAPPRPEPAGSDADPEPTAEPSATQGGTADPTPVDTSGIRPGRDTRLALTAAEDQAGYGYEVAAARLSGDERTSARDRATEHRARAEAWAQVAGVSGTADDPRRVSYTLGSDLDSAEAVRDFCVGLEQQLADSYADAVLDTAAGTESRELAVDRLIAAATALLGWGGTATDLPGMDALVVDSPAPAASASAG